MKNYNLCDFSLEIALVPSPTTYTISWPIPLEHRSYSGTSPCSKGKEWESGCYDTTWKNGILMKLYGVGLRGALSPKTSLLIGSLECGWKTAL